jgi:predicted transcriptional regulator
LVLLDDVIIGLGAAVSAASLVILATLLSRYRTLADDSRKSSELAKNLWDAMNARLTTQDTRIVDLMARLEVYSVRQKPPEAPTIPSATPVAPKPAPKPVTSLLTSQAPPQITPTSQPISQPQVTPPPQIPPRKPRSDTEFVILRTLLEGPRTSNEILAVAQVTREHNGRLLKELYGRGLVVRNDANKPYVYEITEAGRTYLSQA